MGRRVVGVRLAWFGLGIEISLTLEPDVEGLVRAMTESNFILWSLLGL